MDKISISCTRIIVGGVMEILIVRHGEPNYEIDSLTAKGWKEADLLSRKLEKMEIRAFYCSPLGRAQDTSIATLKKMNRQAETLEWLQEISDDCRDLLPSEWTKVEAYYSKDDWMKTELMQTTGTYEIYKEVGRGLDQLLAEHGYVHDGNAFKVISPNHDRIVLFCHYAVGGAILSHLTGVSPMIYWHHFVAMPTSITKLVTEEREAGTAIFRMLYYGDISHLYAGGEEGSFAGRFCECFDDDTRH